MILSFGELLYDEYIDHKVLGGAPFNVAYHITRLGLPCRFVSRIGLDQDGDDLVNELKERHFPIQDIQVDEDHETGRVLVQLDRGGKPDFTILPDVAYDYITYHKAFQAIVRQPPGLVCFGTLMQRSEYGFETVRQIIRGLPPQTRVLYDVNLRPDCFTERAVRASLRECHVVKLSDDEAETVAELVGYTGKISDFPTFLMEDYDIMMVALTQGGKGSRLLILNASYTAHPSKKLRVVDTVGAGDAYTAILSIGLLHGWHPREIVRRATNFAGRMCEVHGAIPPADTFYTPFVKQWQR